MSRNRVKDCQLLAFESVAELKELRPLKLVFGWKWRCLECFDCKVAGFQLVMCAGGLVDLVSRVPS